MDQANRDDHLIRVGKGGERGDVGGGDMKEKKKEGGRS